MLPFINASTPYANFTDVTTISGPNGLLIYNELLFVVNQNLAYNNVNGAVFAYHIPDSVRKGRLSAADLPFARASPDPVPVASPNGPNAPRGIVVGGPGPHLYVADAGAGAPGRLLAFDPTPPYNYTGELLLPSRLYKYLASWAAPQS